MKSQVTDRHGKIIQKGDAVRCTTNSRTWSAYDLTMRKNKIDGISVDVIEKIPERHTSTKRS